MLDKKAAAQTPSKSMQIGDLRFIPTHGICVYSGNEEFEYGGNKEIFYLFSPINNLNS